MEQKQIDRINELARKAKTPEGLTEWERMEQAGLETEYILCSGDPDSLDGVHIPRLRTAIVDGTAPHGTAPLGHPAKKVSICKGLRDRLLGGTSTGHGYLGHFYWTSIQK